MTRRHVCITASTSQINALCVRLMGQRALTKPALDQYAFDVHTDYREYLDAGALALLAEATGRATRSEAQAFFAQRPWEVAAALASLEAEDLLALPSRSARETPDRTGLTPTLEIAIAVHRTAEELCRAGWTAGENHAVDLELVGFCGQQWAQRFAVEVLTSMTRPGASLPGLDVATPAAPAGSVDRLVELFELTESSGETERCGALRLLGDEALYTCSVWPGAAAAQALGPAERTALRHALPRALATVVDELSTPTLLEAHLLLGPIWYRMAASSMLLPSRRSEFGMMARDFSVARRFLVQVAQGRLASARASLFLDPQSLDPQGVNPQGSDRYPESMS